MYVSVRRPAGNAVTSLMSPSISSTSTLVLIVLIVRRYSTALRSSIGGKVFCC